jgi:hypothetical protein
VRHLREGTGYYPGHLSKLSGGNENDTNY